ncbi:MAG TPA: allophanate hydrolase [Candidatus Acidoferrales bacterium]|nr:allophanate hydrolase [Candidatus Acidoferrales bacterium]
MGLVDDVAATLDAIDPADPVWIACLSREAVLARAQDLDALPAAKKARLPLFGRTFGVKDNIDVAGIATTAACPEFAYVPARSATVVERLEAAGAIVVGKTNLDQFATGLVGTRSPYGTPANPFDARYIPGGSSSGSAVAVSRGLVAFALGTDTAGSGRIPAGFTATVGMKPTPGALSTRGVVPACRSLDCVSIFASSVDQAMEILDVARGFDGEDPFSSVPLAPPNPIPEAFRFAIPRHDQRTFCGDAQAEAAFDRAITRLANNGGTPVEVDLTPCFSAGGMLYGDAFVAERQAAIGDFAKAHPEALLDVTRTIIMDGRPYSAAEAFRATYRIRELSRAASTIFEIADVLVVPTSPTIYTLDEIAEEPYARNATLGIYASFVNFFRWCAVSIPSDVYSNGIPIGITLIGPPWADDTLAAFASRIAP